MTHRSKARVLPLFFLLLVTGCLYQIPPSQYLYVSSAGTDQVLRYDASTGEFVEAFVGSTTAGPVQPTGLRFGPRGSLYVSSYATNEVKRYSEVSGRFLENFVPAGHGGLLRPTKLTFGPEGDLYVLSTHTADVKRYDGSTGAYKGTFVSFARVPGVGPVTGLEFGPDGLLYIGFRDRPFATGVESGGVVKRFDGGTGVFVDNFRDFSLPLKGLTFGPDGGLHVLLEWVNQPGEMYRPLGSALVLRYDLDSAQSPVVVVDESGPDGVPLFPLDIRFGPGGDLFVSHPMGISLYFLGHYVAEIVPGFVSEYFDVGLDGRLYISSYSTNEVKRYGVASHTFIDNFVHSHSAGGLKTPSALVLGPDVTEDGWPELYVASYATHEVKLYDGATGEYMHDYVRADDGPLQYPRGLAFGADGYLYVASEGSDMVLRYQPSAEGTEASFRDVFAEPPSPTDLTFGPDAHLYVSSAGAGQVIRYDGATGAFIDYFPPPLPAAYEFLAPPRTLTFAEGSLYVSAGVLYRFDASAGNFLGHNSIDRPHDDLVYWWRGGTVFDGLLVGSDPWASMVWQYESGSAPHTFVKSNDGGLHQPWGMALGPQVPASRATAQPAAVSCEETVYPSEEGVLQPPNGPVRGRGMVLRPGSAVRIECDGAIREFLAVEMGLYSGTWYGSFESVSFHSLQTTPHLSTVTSSGGRIGAELPWGFSGASPSYAFIRVRYKDGGNRDRVIDLEPDYVFIPTYVELLGVHDIDIGSDFFGHQVEGTFPASFFDPFLIAPEFVTRLYRVSLEQPEGFEGTARLKEPCSWLYGGRQGYHIVAPPNQGGTFRLYFSVIAPRGVIPPGMNLLDGYEVLGPSDVSLSGGVPLVNEVIYRPAAVPSFSDGCS